MQLDFHYYATYTAAILAGYTHDESLRTAYCAQFVDNCSRTLLKTIGGPKEAATTQLQLELMDASTDPAGLQDITRIWSSFHFLPGDLHAKKKRCSKSYLNKYRLICNTNGTLLSDTVNLAFGKGEEAAGIAMHVLADTWAHRYFAGTPSLVINNTNYYFYETVPDEDGTGTSERIIKFNHNPGGGDDPEKGIYTNSLYQGNENSIMNLGHGRAGHLPDYSFARYRYLPAWGGYREVVKDNPSDYMQAFTQMIFALKCLKEGRKFEAERYDAEAVGPYYERIQDILLIRQTDASADWKALGEDVSGYPIPDFDIDKYQAEYRNAEAKEKDNTLLGRFIRAAITQKSMVTSRIFESGSKLAGVAR